MDAELERLVEQVHGALALEGVRFDVAEDRSSFVVPHGSTAIYLNFRELGDRPVVSLRAFLLERVDAAPERLPAIYERLNDLNARLYFAKLYLDRDRGSVVLEHDLLGEHLRGAELMHALSTLATLADDLDDELRSGLGSGIRVADAIAGSTGEAADDTGGTGPVVPA